jgi:GAF domain-containing protein
VLPQGWTDLVALLDGHPDADPLTRAKRLCDLCRQVAGVTGVALGVASETARSTVCATDDVADRVEELQDTLGEGPGVDAWRTGHTVLVDDLTAASARWPGFAPAAGEHAVRAVFAFPLRIGALRLGMLSLYRTAAGALSDAQVQDVAMLAEAAAVLLTLDQAGEQSAAAFVWVVGDRSRFRPEVHQAVGATMVHLGVAPREAYARLSAHAYAHGTTIGAVAADIVTKRLALDPD